MCFFSNYICRLGPYQRIWFGEVSILFLIAVCHPMWLTEEWGKYCVPNWKVRMSVPSLPQGGGESTLESATTEDSCLLTELHKNLARKYC